MPEMIFRNIGNPVVGHDDLMKTLLFQLGSVELIITGYGLISLKEAGSRVGLPG